MIYNIFLILCVVVASTFGATRPYNPRIVGGEEIDICKVPYQILLMINYRHTCGGAIVNENTVITAAHCTQNAASNYQIRAGSSSQHEGGQVIQVSQIYNHPEYSRNTFDNDVAIVKLERRLTIGPCVQPVVLAGKGFYVPDNGIARIAGWGDLWSGGGTYPERIRYVDVPVTNQDVCRRSYGHLTPRMICAGLTGQSTCQGDSGGPLVYNGVHVGIVSHAVGCAYDGYPTVYSRTSELRDFIDKHT